MYVFCQLMSQLMCMTHTWFHHYRIYFIILLSYCIIKEISNNFILFNFTITCQLIWKKGGKFQIFLAPILDGEIDDAIFDLKSWQFATCKVWWNIRHSRFGLICGIEKRSKPIFFQFFWNYKSTPSYFIMTVCASWVHVSLRLAISV